MSDADDLFNALRENVARLYRAVSALQCDVAEAEEANAELRKSARPATGERCPRCHYTAPNASNGCALCNPERLGERLEEALEDNRRLANELDEVKKALRAWGGHV